MEIVCEPRINFCNISQVYTSVMYKMPEFYSQNLFCRTYNGIAKVQFTDILQRDTLTEEKLRKTIFTTHIIEILIIIK